MAFESMGLGGVFTFDGQQGVQAMGKTRDEMGRFVATGKQLPPVLGAINAALKKFGVDLPKTFSGIAAGADKISGAMKSAALAATPAAIGLGLGVKKAADFEHQMSAVGAVTQASAADMKRLEMAAKEAGASSVFNATQSAQAMEEMAKAGATTDQIIAGLGGVMSAAAAEGLGLAEASSIVSTVIKGQGKDFAEAGHVADVLAMAAAKTNTDIRGLGEAFTYGGLQGHSLGFGMEELAATFGKLSDAGLKGSMSGTALSSMLTHLIKPSKAGVEIMERFNFSVSGVGGKMKPLSGIMSELIGKLDGVKSVEERNAMATKLFGVEGARAYSALKTAGVESLGALTEELKKSSEEGGFANKQAEARMDNFLGSIEQFSGAVEGMFLEVFLPMMRPFAATLNQITEGVSGVVKAVMILRAASEDTFETELALNGLTTKYGETVTSVALGVVDAIGMMRDGWNSIVARVSQVAKLFESKLGGDGLRTLTKLAIVGVVIAGAMVPVIGAFGAIAFIITSVLIPAISGLAGIVSAVFWPVLVVLGLVGLAFALLRKENETFFQTAMRIWGAIKDAALYVWNSVLVPIGQGMAGLFGPALETIGESFSFLVETVKFLFSTLWEETFGGMSGMAVNWKAVGEVIVMVLTVAIATVIEILGGIIMLLTGAVKIIAVVFRWLWDVISSPFIALYDLVMNVVAAIKMMFNGSVIDGFARLGVAIADFMLSPLMFMLRQIIKIADAIPGAGKLVPQALRDFSEGGLTSIVFPKKPGGAPVVDEKAAANTAAKTAADAVGLKAAEKKAQAEKPAIEATVKVEDKRTTEVNTNLNLDGETVARSSSKHKQEISDRAGFKATPWQRRMGLEQGAAPVRGAGSGG